MQMPDRANGVRVLVIRLWIGCLAALVFAMVVVGGATRLTQSGLSIVEWKPVTGVIPPLSHADWQVEFDKYKTIPQYERVNRGMSLDEFKTIFWWEWSHRLLARVVGAAFLLPFLWFWWRGWVDRRPRRRAGRNFHAGWSAGGGGLVDGGVGTDRTGRGVSVPAGISSLARLPHLCGAGPHRRSHRAVAGAGDA